jgi:exopolysaccharide biosynthesis polyprenyl glycosylphosphotransferase
VSLHERPASPHPFERRRAVQPQAGLESDRPPERRVAMSLAGTPAPSARSAVRGREAIRRRALAVSDVLSAALALFVGLEVLAGAELKALALLALPLVTLGSKLIGLYDRDDFVLHKSSLEEAPRLFQLSALFALAVWMLEGWALQGDVEQSQVLGLLLGMFLLGFVGRVIVRFAVRRLTPEERCLVVGDRVVADQLTDVFARSSGMKAKIAEALPLHDRRGGFPWTSRNLHTVVTRLNVHRVLIVPSSTTGVSKQVLDLVRLTKSLGVRVSVFPRLLEAVGSSVEFDDVGGMPIVGVRNAELPRSSLFLKRGLDLVGAAVGLVLLSPFMALCAAAIKLESPGPVFFWQRRVGRSGRVFEMAKFRTMSEDADRKKDDLRQLNEAQGIFKIRDDPRITRVGRLLRPTSLDELPQLWNVLRGEMSLVGPRPLPEDEDRQVSGWDRERLNLTPGITGHWQILGSARIPLHEMVKIDYLYVANWSLWTDIKLLLRTVPHVIARRGQ